MDRPSPAFDAARRDPEYDHDETEKGSLNRLAGPGTSRQTRRLQLRNAGFRGAALPTRKVTPKSMPSSNWSSAGGRPGSSDAENVSPSGWKQSTVPVERRESSGILQEIGNSTMTRRKKPRPRMSSTKLFSGDDSGGDNATYENVPISPPPPKTTIRARSVRSKPKVTHRRRSVSAEMSKYIEHLESELATTQSQLSAIALPTVVKEHNSKMRTLNVESKHLQDELAEWEAKYEQRVQEEVDKHCAVESALRNRILHLEQDVEDTRLRVHELEVQLDGTSENLQAVEAANLNLEKRIEIMSELLAASPTKIDFNAQTPGRSQKHIRPKSMLPRFPTASSLITSPERQPRTQPTSPMFSFANLSPTLLHSPSHSALLLDNSPLQSDYTSEAESVFSEASFTGDSMTSTENFEGRTSFNPWNMPPPPNNKSKPVRRMRRFGAGSMGPKPLILPSTSQYDNSQPSSAPALERRETTPVIAFPRPRFDELGSPLGGRRRASTIATELSIPHIIASPIDSDTTHEFNDETLLSLSSPVSPISHDMTQRLSSFGSVGGRNLMDELTAIRSNEWTESTEPASDVQTRTRSWSGASLVKTGSAAAESSNLDEIRLTSRALAADTESRVTSTTSGTAVPAHHRKRSRSVNIPAAGCSVSAFDRLRFLFGDLWRSPIELARHLIQAAQARVRIPRPLLNVQWWLVGVLLGPMARRRLASHGECCDESNEESLLLRDTPAKSITDQEMAYGTMHETPPAPSTPNINRSTGRRRRHTVTKTRCVHRRSRHSPWLWLKFSITLAFAIGAAFKDGPGSLLKSRACVCRQTNALKSGEHGEEEDVSSQV